MTQKHDASCAKAYCNGKIGKCTCGAEGSPMIPPLENFCPVSKQGCIRGCAPFDCRDKSSPSERPENMNTATALRELLTAVTFMPPRNYGTADDPNHCYGARVPVEFVDNAAAALRKVASERPDALQQARMEVFKAADAWSDDETAATYEAFVAAIDHLLLVQRQSLEPKDKYQAGDSIRDAIMRRVCEMPRNADPADDETIVLTYEELSAIVTNELEASLLVQRQSWEAKIAQLENTLQEQIGLRSLAEDCAEHAEAELLAQRQSWGQK